jgi:hypothetical protein
MGSHKSCRWWVSSPPPSSYCAEHCKSVKLYSSLSVFDFVLYKMKPLFNHWTCFMLPKSVQMLLKVNSLTFYASWSSFIFLLLVLHQFLEPHRDFAFKVESSVHNSNAYDSSVSPNWSQITRVWCKSVGCNILSLHFRMSNSNLR